MDDIRIAYLANAGLLLDFAGTKVLVDGLYDSPPEGFSPIPETVLEKLLSASPPFDGIDRLFFTHTHPDHFSRVLTEEYMRKNPVKGLVVPPLAPEGLSFSLPSGIEARAVPTRHLGKRFADVPHLCYLFSFRGKNILITADVDYTAETFDMLAGLHFRAVFVNPLFFGALCHGRFFRGSLDAEQICAYHVPFARDDSFGIRAQLKRDMDRWEKQGKAPFAFTEAGQTLTL